MIKGHFMSQLFASRPSYSWVFCSALTFVSAAHAMPTPVKAASDSTTATNNKPSGLLVEKDKLLTCSKISDNTARLACFDKVTTGSIEPTKKAPLDLAKTVEVSLKEGKAVAVLAVNQPTESALDTIDSQSDLEEDIVADAQDNDILQEVGITKADIEQYTPLSVLFDLDKNDPKGILTVRPHLPMYVMPVWYNATPNYDIHSPNQKSVVANHDALQNLDTKMQISLKTKLAEDVFGTNADVWVGYTQQSYWQLYNRHSRPFRSSDYQPEIFLTQPVKAQLPFNGTLRLLGAGLVHQSNGQSDPLSRSWNRAYVMAGTEWGNLTVIPRLWLIGKESNKASDNPDIGDYMGYGDIRWLYGLDNHSTVGGVMRYNPSTHNGAVQIDYAYPLTGGMKAYIQLFHGYGENVQDYNHKSTNVGIGLMFNDFKGL